MITREQFNLDESYYYLSALEKISISENRRQYLLKVTFNRLNKDFDLSKKIVFKKKDHSSDFNNYLSYYIFSKNSKEGTIDNQISLRFSFKEYPLLVIGTIWQKGKIVHSPKGYLEPKKITLEFDLKNKFTSFLLSKSLKDPWNLLPNSLSEMNVFKFYHNKTLFILPVYETIRAFYCECSRISYSCFNGKKVFRQLTKESAKQLFDIPEDVGFVLLEKQIKDERAGLALKLMENEHFHAQFLKVYESIVNNKENNGPLISFPVDWKTEITFYATNLYENSVLINCITDYTPFKSKYVSGKYGRVNDGRKGENSNSSELIKTNKPRRVKPTGDLNSHPIGDSAKVDNEIEPAEVNHDLVNTSNSNLKIEKIEKVVQFYTNENTGTWFIDGEIVGITTEDEKTEGSKIGELNISGYDQFLTSTFNDLLEYLNNLIYNTFSLRPTKLVSSNGDFEFEPEDATNETAIKYWCFMKKKDGVYSELNRKIGIFMFKKQNHYCYIFEVQHRPITNRNAIGIAVSKKDLSQSENKKLLEALLLEIKIKKGHPKAIRRDAVENFRFGSQSHLKNYELLKQNLIKTVDDLIIAIGV